MWWVVASFVLSLSDDFVFLVEFSHCKPVVIASDMSIVHGSTSEPPPCRGLIGLVDTRSTFPLRFQLEGVAKDSVDSLVK